MPLSPEIFSVLSRALTDNFKDGQCSGIKAGNGWLAMFFRPGEKRLFISWVDPWSGICNASESEISQLGRTESRSFPFTDILQKHIIRSTLTNIERVASDRIISFRFSRLIGAGIETSRTLVVELTGRRSNIFLLRDDGSIMESARPSRKNEDSYNTNRPGCCYSPPPSFIGVNPVQRHDPGLFFSLEGLSGLGRTLGSRLKENWHLFPHRTWTNYIREMSTLPSPQERRDPFLQSTDSTLLVFPTPIGNCKVLEEDLLELLREYTITPLLSERLKSKKQSILKNIDRRSSKLASIRRGLENQIRQSERAMEYREIGELLLSNSARVPRGADSVTLPQWGENGFTDTIVKLDPSISVSQNAQNFFRKYKKFNVKRSAIDEKLVKLSEEEKDTLALFEIARTTEDPDILFEISDEISSGSRAQTGRSSQSSHGPVKIFEFCGTQVIAGTNSKSNRKVTFVFAAGDDLWFHARGVPGGHVIVKSKKDHDDKEHIIKFAASLAAHFSKSTEAEKVDVDYTRRKYVRSVPGTIAEVTYSRARTISVSPLLWEKLLSENRQAQGEAWTGNA